MKISEIITDKYKLRIPPTVYYDLLADVREVEEEQEPTAKNDLGVDCVSRDVVKNYIQAHIHEIITESGEDKNKHTNRVLRSMIHGVNCMPSVTPQEPKTGHWNEIPKYKDIAWQCSECERFTTMKHNYCPKCGAKMVEPQESADMADRTEEYKVSIPPDEEIKNSLVGFCKKIVDEHEADRSVEDGNDANRV